MTNNLRSFPHAISGCINIFSLKNIFLFFITIAANNAFANSVTGFGDYKVGMSIDEFLGVSEINSLVLRDKTDLFSERGYLLKTTFNSNLKDTNSKLYSEDLIKFEFPAATGLKENFGSDSRSATVIFYKNKLAKISLSDPPNDFIEILKSKYGRPKIIDNTSLITCQNGFGAKSRYKNGGYSHIWPGKGGVIAEYYSFFSGCGGLQNYYSVKDEKADKIINDIQKKGVDRDRAEQLKAKASESSKL
jgi:hypothetical protein